MSFKRKNLQCSLSQTLFNAVEQEAERTGETVSHIVERALAHELDIAHHSLFQVSTSRALVEGVFGGCTTVAHLKEHGDFGLGTFDQLDGELVMLDGRCYQITQGGVAREVGDEVTVPFATLTRFSADSTVRLDSSQTLGDLTQQLDRLRPSENLFVGFRIEGTFEKLELRAACKARPGEKLVAAIEHQSSFEFTEITGTLVGFYSPPYSSAIGVPGYHFHFIDDQRRCGGHVFNLSTSCLAGDLIAQLHVESDIHLALPETQEFLETDLNRDRSCELKSVETDDREPEVGGDH